MEVTINGKRVRIDARALLGQGGEAEVYDLKDGRVFKRFKTSAHTDFSGSPVAQQAAADRIAEHEHKLPVLMRATLPACVIRPEALVHDRHGLVGYTMRKIDGCVALADHAQATIRRSTGGGERNVDVLKTLHRAVSAVHAARVVIGDFNDANVLVRGGDVFMIDADSYQLDRFVCRVFSERFVDPRLCAEQGGAMTLVRPHDEASDWYAFAVITMQLLLLAGPHAGVYRPRPGALRLPPSLRPLERITVFHPDVQYPKPALPLASLPDALLGTLEDICVRDVRAPLSLASLEALRFTRCSGCGGEHARAVCPFCTQAKHVVHRVSVRGKVTERLLLRTEGAIVAAATDGDAVYSLRHEAGVFVREDGSRVMNGALDPALRFALLPRATIVGSGHRLAVIGDAGTRVRTIAKNAFAAHGSRAVYVGQDGVRRIEDDEALGTVLENDAHVWLGPRFGLGIYRLGELTVGYVFTPERKGLTDSLRPTCVRGRVIDMACVLGDVAWLCVAREEAGRRIDACLLIDAQGRLLSAIEGDARDVPWLASAKIGAAVGQALLVPTDQGIVRIEANGAALVVSHVYDATEPFVDAGARLLPTPRALLVHTAHELRALTLEVS